MDKLLATSNVPTVWILAVFCCLILLLCATLILLVLLFRIRAKFASFRRQSSLVLNHHKPLLPSLVNLPVRHEFIQFLTDIFPQAKKRKEKLALLFLDLDNFKDINDALGIDVGDLLLEEVARRIVAEVKIDSHIISHFGGGEFVILIGFFEENTIYVTDLVNKLLFAINNSFHIVHHDILISASVGVSMFPEHTDIPENLLRYADMARYNAKQCGKNTYSFYNESMNKKTLARTLMYADLRKALENNEFVLHYQPKICATTNAVVGAEALLRWEHPIKGCISPEEFIPVAEDSGMIVPIGKWILRTVGLDLQRLKIMGFIKFTMAINLSAYQFNHGDIAGNIAAVLWKTNISPALLELELTESVVMQSAEKSLLMLRVLKAMGVKIAIDDFGTGYSSLSHLRDFPIDILKIDQSFIKNMHLDTNNATIVATIISMAKQLGLEVVAEGVEHQEEVDLLVQKGCNYLQGYFYSPPISINQLIEFIKQRV